MEETKKNIFKTFMGIYQYEKQIEQQRKVIIQDYIDAQITFNPFSYFHLILNNQNYNQHIGSISLDDFIKFLQQQSITFDTRTIQHFFQFYSEANRIQVQGLLKLLCPIENILQALSKDYTSLNIKPLTLKNEKEFLKLIILELSFSMFLMEQYISTYKDITDENFREIFQKGKSVEEKLVYFLKETFKSKLNEDDLQLLFFRLKRKTNIDEHLINLFKYPELDLVPKPVPPPKPVDLIEMNGQKYKVEVDLENNKIDEFLDNQVFSKTIKKTTKKKGKKGTKKTALPTKGKKNTSSMATKLKSKKVTSKATTKKNNTGRKSITSTRSMPRGKSKSVRISKTKSKSGLKKKKKKVTKKKVKKKVEETPVDCTSFITKLEDFENQYDNIRKKTNKVYSPFEVLSLEDRLKKENTILIKDLVWQFVDNAFKKIDEKRKKEEIELRKVKERLEKEKKEQKNMAKSFLGQFQLGTNNLKGNITSDPMMFLKKKPERALAQSMMIVQNTSPLLNETLKKNVNKTRLETSMVFNQGFNMKGTKSEYCPKDDSILNRTDLQTSRISKLQNFLDKPRQRAKTDLNITGLSNILISQNPLQLLLSQLFKKQIVYNSKLDDLRQQLLDLDDTLNLIDIFDFYDVDEKAYLTSQNLMEFFNDQGFQMTSHRLIRVMTYLVQFNNREMTQDLTFMQFVKIFLPSKWTNEKSVNYLQKLSEKENFNDEFISQQQFHVIRQILIITFKKIDDYTVISRELNKNFSTQNIFECILQNQYIKERQKISIQNLKNFLDENNVRFLDEDLIYIFSEFKTENDSVTFNEFKNFVQVNLNQGNLQK